MGQTVVIPTLTIITIFWLDIEVYTWYWKVSDLDLLKVFLAEEIGMINQVSFLEGEGLGTANQIPEHILPNVNAMGELDLIEGENSAQVENYSIDSEGYLIYTIP